MLQVRSSEMCTPRYLKLETTAVLPMCLGLFCIDTEVVVSAPALQVFHLLPVVGLVVVSDVSNHSLVIHELYNQTAQVFR